MAETVPGSVAAKEAGLALAQIYNYIRKGLVKNHKADGWPTGKGVEVVLAEVIAARDSTARKPRAPKGSKASGAGGRVSRKARHEEEVTMHEALDEEERERRARKRSSGDEGNSVRLTRADRSASKYPPCPIFPEHGNVSPTDMKKGQSPKYHCWHQSHDGRPRTHPGGFAPATQSTFTQTELEMPQPAGRLGVLMLEWIIAGRTDLSESLEAWCVKNKLPVWIPVR